MVCAIHYKVCWFATGRGDLQNLFITYAVRLDFLASQLSPTARKGRIHDKLADLVFGFLGCKLRRLL